MLQTDLKKIDTQWDNIIKSYTLNLDDNLDCFILFSCKDQSLADLLYHKITDAVIDRIHPKNVYKDFSQSLENINAFLRNWKHEDGKIKWLHALIGIYSKKTFLFSTIWKASCYLYNSGSDVIEVTDSDDRCKDFSFISSGEIASGELMILSTMNLLDILSKDDITDGLYDRNIELSAGNIYNILLQENISKNVGIIHFKKSFQGEKTSSINYEKISYYILKACDNSIIKKILWYLYHIKDRIISQSRQVKQILLWVGFLVSAILLYMILSSFLSVANIVSSTEDMKQDLIIAQENIQIASQNMNNEDTFNLNVQQANDAIQKLEEKNLFLSDIQILRDRIGILQKQFNGIETFSTNSENTVFNFGDDGEEIVKVLSVNNTVYVVHPKSLTGPIFSGQESEKYIFEDMVEGDSFIDAAVFDTNIVLLTDSWRVVNFSRNNFYLYSDVLGQDRWGDSPLLASYASNIYMLSDQKNQILMHKRNGQNYNAGIAYLTDEDAISTGRILSLAIDGGIYILKLDGSVVKLFRSPEYRLESLVLNNLPKNYNFDSLDSSKLPSLRARIDLSYVYMLLDHRILVFKPNTTNFRDTKSLSYVGQIEGKDITIEDFYVDNDGEIFVASTGWIYKLEFDVGDNGLIVK